MRTEWVAKRQKDAVRTQMHYARRGMITPEGVEAIHAHLLHLLEEAGAPRLDAIYFCPHHPQHAAGAYRRECSCRKPLPGMLLQAAGDFGLDLGASYIIGDKLADVEAVLLPGDTVLADSLERGWYRVTLDGEVFGYVHRSTLVHP